MNENIIRFLQQQTCASICCADEEGKPYCFSCFYAFDKEEGLLYFKSSAEAHHSVLMQKNPFIAGTVLPDKLNTILVRGLQFEGIVLDANDSLTAHASVHYHKKHPMALAMPGAIWTVQINSMKMTDSTKGFGKKFTWSRELGVLS
jgi:uncharacterized protein